MENEILKWLEGKRDYQRGLEILSKVCKNPILVIQLRKKDNEYNRSKIVAELENYINSKKSKVAGSIFSNLTVKIVNAVKKVKEGIKEQGFPPTTIQTTNRTTSNTKSISDAIVLTNQKEDSCSNFIASGLSSEQILEAVEKIKAGITAMMNKRGILSNSLSEDTNHTDRMAIIAQMDDITNSLNDARSKIDYFNKFNDLPPLVAPTTSKPTQVEYSSDPATLLRTLNNLRSRRSKLLKEIKNSALSELQLQDKNKRMVDVVKEINEIERRLAHG